MCATDNKLVLLVGVIGCISYVKGVIFQFYLQIYAHLQYLLLTV